jgi:3-hydroxybutyryl-CoA dehydrogenase
LKVLFSLAVKMGKTPVIARDTPGFIVNRVARPFYGEALRMLGEGVASHDIIDRIVRQGAGFRMGPFELMDLIGIDVNLAATRSLYEQTFQEPRYRPHRIQVSMVAQRALGRKTGRGFYQYDTSQSPIEEPEPTLTNGQPAMAGKVYITPGRMAPGMEEIIRNYLPVTPDVRDPALQLVVVTAGQAEGLQETLRSLSQKLPGNTPILCQCGDITLAESAIWIDKPQRLAGFDGLFFAQGDVACLVAHPKTSPETCSAVEKFIIHCGWSPIWVEDSPGLILPRLVCALANEAAFALGEGVADAATIDRAMQLGTNYPKGPLSWAKELGYTQTIAVLDFLHSEFGEERYRIAPLLRQWARWELESVTPKNHH